MKIKIVRFIDYWLGIPLCFLFSVISKAKNFLFHKVRPISCPRKILFIEFSEMGSSILAYSAMVKAKKLYPKAELYFLIFQENKEVLDFIDVIPSQNIITIRFNPFTFFLGDMIKSIHHIRKNNIDTVIDLELFTRFSAIFTYLTGAVTRVGFYRFTLEGLYRGDLHTHKVKYNPYFHIRENFIALVDALEEDKDKVPLVKKEINTDLSCLPKVKIEDKDKRKVKDRIAELCCGINLKDKDIVTVRFDFSDRVSLRMWPKENYLKLARRLLDDQRLIVVFVGKDKEEVDSSYQDERLINLTGETTVKELVTIFSFSKLVVGHDGGIIHLASLVDTHVVALYGPETPSLYGLINKRNSIIYKKFHCSPCVTAYNHRRSVCRDNKCMQSIAVQEVYNNIRQNLTHEIRFSL